MSASADPEAVGPQATGREAASGREASGREASGPGATGPEHAGAGGRSHGIAARLRDDILRGDYREGDRLPAERELATRLGVNRGSIREALKQLEQLGLVDIRRGGGARVRPVGEASIDVVRHLLHAGGTIDPALAFQILDVHEIMVAGAARLAVERASSAQLAEARALLARFADADDAVEERIAACDALFGLITEASDNLVLRMIHNAIRPVLCGELGQHLWRALRPSASVLARQIGDIDQAIEAGDALGAEEAVRRLLRDRRERLTSLLREPEATHPTSATHTTSEESP